MQLLDKNRLWLCAILFILCSCSQAQKQVPLNNESLKDKKILIVYLSRTKNTRAVAEIIHQKVGGDMVALELVTP